MRLDKRFHLFFRTLRPGQYRRLCSELRLRHAVSQFLFTFTLLFLLMLLLFTFGAGRESNNLAEKMSSFDELILDGEFSTSAPVILAERPRIIVNLEENVTLEDERALLTKEGIFWKQWFFFGEEMKPWAEIKNARTLPPSTFTLLFLFIAPALAFWLGILLFIKYLLLILLFGFLAYLLPRMWGHKTSLANAFKLTIFSSTMMLLVEMLLLPFFSLFWLSLLLFLLMLAIGIAFVGGGVVAEPKKEKKSLWDQ